ncbi:M15 family metallopeptidase [Bacillus timonensis]|nr:M15 family metallopeptidase [Bacillus timonensis]
MIFFLFHYVFIKSKSNQYITFSLLILTLVPTCLSIYHSHLWKNNENVNPRRELNDHAKKEIHITQKIENINYFGVRSNQFPVGTRVSHLHPLIRSLQVQLKLLAAEQGVMIMFPPSDGFRSFEFQQTLYNQGRTHPGHIVTDAIPGSSYHNWGLAFDFVVLDNNMQPRWNIDADYDNDSQNDWHEVGNIGQSLGLEWGGAWTDFVDYPHFQVTFGLSIPQLRTGRIPVGSQIERIPHVVVKD